MTVFCETIRGSNVFYEVKIFVGLVRIFVVPGNFFDMFDF